MDTMKEKSVLRSVKFQLPLLFILSSLMLTGIFAVLVYVRFQSRMIDEYSHIAKGATNLMALELDGDKTDEYIEKNFELDEYNNILKRFYEIRDSYPDILYMYVYRLSPDGGTVVFDLNSPDGSEDAGTPGDHYEFTDIFMESIDALCAGKEVPGLMGPTEDGYMITYCKPIFDSNGVVQCHACVDFSIDNMRKEDLSFMISIIAITSATAIIITFISLTLIKIKITEPLNHMSSATTKFSYQTEEDYRNNLDIMRSLNIHSGDEIETVYNVFTLVLEQSMVHMYNLSEAETDLKNKEKEIGQISITAFRDALTSVGNKAAFNGKIDELNKAIESGGTEFGIVMLDINNLKYINDNFGHDVGDTYIKGCCHIICDIFKKSPVYRIGGDEFVVILINHDYENRYQLCDEINAEFDRTYAQTDKHPWERYSMSLGMAEYISDDTNVEQIFKRADKEMYIAKTEFKRKNGSYR